MIHMNEELSTQLAAFKICNPEEPFQFRLSFPAQLCNIKVLLQFIQRHPLNSGMELSVPVTLLSAYSTWLVGFVKHMKKCRPGLKFTLILENEFCDSYSPICSRDRMLLVEDMKEIFDSVDFSNYGGSLRNCIQELKLFKNVSYLNVNISTDVSNNHQSWELAEKLKIVGVKKLSLVLENGDSAEWRRLEILGTCLEKVPGLEELVIDSCTWNPRIIARIGKAIQNNVRKLTLNGVCDMFLWEAPEQDLWNSSAGEFASLEINRKQFLELSLFCTEMRTKKKKIADVCRLMNSVLKCFALVRLEFNAREATMIPVYDYILAFFGENLTHSTFHVRESGQQSFPSSSSQRMGQMYSLATSFQYWIRTFIALPPMLSLLNSLNLQIAEKTSIKQLVTSICSLPYIEALELGFSNQVSSIFFDHPGNADQSILYLLRALKCKRKLKKLTIKVLADVIMDSRILDLLLQEFPDLTHLNLLVHFNYESYFVQLLNLLAKNTTLICFGQSLSYEISKLEEVWALCNFLAKNRTMKVLEYWISVADEEGYELMVQKVVNEFKRNRSLRCFNMEYPVPTIQDLGHVMVLTRNLIDGRHADRLAQAMILRRFLKQKRMYDKNLVRLCLPFLRY